MVCLMTATREDVSGGHLPLARHVGAMVKMHLQDRGVSASWAATKLGWTQPFISRRITGAKAFDVAELEALGDLLGVPVTSFFTLPSALTRVPGEGLTNAGNSTPMITVISPLSQHVITHVHDAPLLAAVA
jgi:hypothetical protein